MGEFLILQMFIEILILIFTEDDKTDEELKQLQYDVICHRKQGAIIYSRLLKQELELEHKNLVSKDALLNKNVNNSLLF